MTRTVCVLTVFALLAVKAEEERFFIDQKGDVIENGETPYEDKGIFLEISMGKENGQYYFTIFRDSFIGVCLLVLKREINAGNVS